MSGEPGGEGAPPEETGQTQPSRPDAPSPAKGADLDKLASEMYPSKTIPQFKMLTMDPLGEVASGKGAEPKANGGDEANPKTWPDGTPVVDRGGSGTPDEQSDGQPSNQVSDIDKAIEMAKAGDQPRSEEAYLRQNAKLKEEEQSESWSPSRAKVFNEKREELVGKYKPSMRDSVARYKNADSEDSLQRAEEIKPKAERLEYWAGEIHDHPEFAGEMTPEECVNIEHWLEVNSYRPEEIDSEVERLRERSEQGNLSLAGVMREFTEFFGPVNQNTEMHKRFRELTSRDETTVGEIKEFLFTAISKSAEEWRDVLDVSRQRLAIIQGK